MAMESSIRPALNLTSGWYFIKPCLLRSWRLTILKKYQLRPASTIKMRTLDMRSQYLLISTKLSRI